MYCLLSGQLLRHSLFNRNIPAGQYVHFDGESAQYKHGDEQGKHV